MTHDDRGISNCEIGWILWSALMIGLGALIIVVAI